MIYNFAPTSLEEKLHADLRAYVLAHLPVRATERPALEALPVYDLLAVWLNWQSRLVAAKPRRVHLSDALREMLDRAAPETQKAVQAICNRTGRGEAVTPFLSRRILIGYERQVGAAKRLNRRRDLDLLLNDWGVHHLHLSTQFDTDGFCKRTSALLLAVFHDEDAYFITIVDHGDWTRDDIMAIVVRQWPDAGIVFEMRGILAGDPYSPEYRRDLRNAGVTALLAVDGKAYMTRSALSSAGTSMTATRVGDYILEDIRSFAQTSAKDPAWIMGMILKSGRSPPAQPRFRFVLLDLGYGVLEEVSGTVIRLR